MSDFPELDTPLYEDDLAWLQDNASNYIKAISECLQKGNTPEQIYQHYMSKAAHRHPFWVRVKHAAIAMQRGLG